MLIQASHNGLSNLSVTAWFPLKVYTRFTDKLRFVVKTDRSSSKTKRWKPDEYFPKTHHKHTKTEYLQHFGSIHGQLKLNKAGSRTRVSQKCVINMFFESTGTFQLSECRLIPDATMEVINLWGHTVRSKQVYYEIIPVSSDQIPAKGNWCYIESKNEINNRH